MAAAWLSESDVAIPLVGLNLDAVWDNMVKGIVGGEWNSALTLEENIGVMERKDKLRREIDRLEKSARKETQPKRKFEFVARKRKLEEELASI